MNRHVRKHGSGFSLVEVMVATAVLGVGLAGLAALLLGSISGTASARSRTSAALMAESMAELVAISPGGSSAFFSAIPASQENCFGDSECTPTMFAAGNLVLWAAEVHRALPAATSILCGPADDIDCEGRSNLVSLSWPAVQADAAAPDVSTLTLRLSGQ